MSAAPIFDDSGPERSIRRGLFICGALCIAGTVGPAVGNMRLQLIGVLGYAGVLPVVCFMLARLFRSDHAERPISPSSEVSLKLTGPHTTLTPGAHTLPRPSGAHRSIACPRPTTP
jgi:hypothetical protein